MYGRNRNARLLTGGLVGVPPGYGDEYWDDVTLLLDGSGTTDLSTASSTVTPSGSGYTTGNISGAKFGQYIDLQNSGYFNVALASALGVSGDPFTVETWVYFDVDGNDGVFQLYEPGDTLNSTPVDGTQSLAVARKNGTWTVYNGTGTVNSIASAALSTWHHVALVYDGSALVFYVNGAALHTESSWTPNGTGYPNIGIGGYYDTTVLLDGYIEDFRVTKGVARYTSNFTLPTARFPTNAPIVGRRGVGTEATLRTRGYIGAAPAGGGIDPADHFKAVAFTGNGASQRAVTGVGFQPDFIWLKSRDNATSHQIVDVARGDTKALLTNSTNAEGDTQTEFGGGGVETIDADGFTLGDGVNNNNNFNGSGDKSIAWCLKAGTEAGFSVVTYTGNGNTANVTHGLSSKPEFIITKMTSSGTSQWMVYHKDLSGNATGDNPYNLYLNGTSEELDLSAWGTYENITSSTFPVSRQSTATAHNNNSGSEYVAYCFHSVEGFSKVGSYSGSASSTTSTSENNYVELGFRPAFIMFKRVTNADDWIIVDHARDTDNTTTTRLRANTAAEEDSNAYALVDFNASGFTLRGGNAGLNYTGNDYLYLAFAESNTLSGPGGGMLTLYDRYIETLS